MADYPKPSLTADAVVLAGSGAAMSLLVIERGNAPFRGSFALPGGFVDPGELPYHACLRELEEETGLKLSLAEGDALSLRAKPGRDPRGWTVSQPFVFHLPEPRPVTGRDDARHATWIPLNDLGALAFDHGAILCEALAGFWSWMPHAIRRLSSVPGYAEPPPPHRGVTFFGGSFNPWHPGHHACLDAHPDNRLLVVVPDANPFKATHHHTCSWQRYRDLLAIVSPANASLYPGFCGHETANPTVRWLPFIPMPRRALLIGADSFADLPGWYEADHLVENLETLYIVPRQTSDEDMTRSTQWFENHHPAVSLVFLNDHPYRHLSSTAIRANASTTDKQGEQP